MNAANLHKKNEYVYSNKQQNYNQIYIYKYEYYVPFVLNSAVKQNLTLMEHMATAGSTQCLQLFNEYLRRYSSWLNSAQECVETLTMSALLGIEPSTTSCCTTYPNPAPTDSSEQLVLFIYLPLPNVRILYMYLSLELNIIMSVLFTLNLLRFRYLHTRTEACQVYLCL